MQHYVPLVCLVIMNCLHPRVHGFEWQGNWAMDCDFLGNDLSNAQMPGDQCGASCATTSGCTHFTWTNHNGGTCWMKRGGVSKSQAVYHQGAVCGVNEQSPPPSPSGDGVELSVVNRCSQSIWLATTPNSNHRPLADGTVRLNQGASYTYRIPKSGWAGRFWPKIQCDGAGNNCLFGQSSEPCPQDGCQPPADTKIEFNFPAQPPNTDSWYDISLVDGYSLPIKIVPRGVNRGSCVPTDCHLSLNQCPTNEGGIGDLRVYRDSQLVACLSPCKKWNYPAPYGHGRNEHEQPGVMMCCPTPPISSPQCIAGPVSNTQYVNLVHSACPSAYRLTAG